MANEWIKDKWFSIRILFPVGACLDALSERRIKRAICSSQASNYKTTLDFKCDREKAFSLCDLTHHSIESTFNIFYMQFGHYPEFQPVTFNNNSQIQTSKESPAKPDLKFRVVIFTGKAVRGVRPTDGKRVLLFPRNKSRIKRQVLTCPCWSSSLFVSLTFSKETICFISCSPVNGESGWTYSLSEEESRGR